MPEPMISLIMYTTPDNSPEVQFDLPSVGGSHLQKGTRVWALQKMLLCDSLNHVQVCSAQQVGLIALRYTLGVRQACV